MASNDEVCTACKRIDIERLLNHQRVELHDNLGELRSCGSHCYICNQACSSIRTARASGQARRTWNTQERDADFHVIVEYGRWLGFASLHVAVSDSHVSSKFVSQTFLSIPNLWLYLWTVEGDPLVDVGIDWVRQLPSDTSHPATLALAKRWVESCVNEDCDDLTFGSTNKPPMPINKLPTRLIELGLESTNAVRLINGEDADVYTYVALSYSWGTTTPIWQTTTENLEARQKSFPLNELPKTIRDANDITGRLGVHYLWIDSLCIIQDDKKDWAREAARMTEVYMNAYVTIAASVSEGSTGGIFNQRTTSRLDTIKYLEISADFSNGKKSVVYLFPKTPEGRWDIDVSRARLSTRAWCCQERLLSPRVLHFGLNQIYWECRHRIRSEDNFDQGRSRRRVDKLFAALDAGPGSQSASSRPAEPISIQDFLKVWYNSIIEKDYSHRNLTYGKDKLTALSGLAQAFYKVNSNAYYAGLWEYRMLCGLCWRRGIDAAGTAKEYRAPSWSWASQLSRVMYPIEFKEPVKQYAVVEHVSVKCVSQDTFGAVSDAMLRIVALTIPGTVGEATEIPADGDVIDLAGGYPG